MDAPQVTLFDSFTNDIVNSVRGILCDYNFGSQHHRYFTRFHQHKRIVETYYKLEKFIKMAPALRTKADIFINVSDTAWKTLIDLHTPMCTGKTVEEDFMHKMDSEIRGMCQCLDDLVVTICGRHANFYL
ncbi:unnamed protein product [Caenorhabditis bovis]|uniref:Uncharacterized protein n=1 Tax=Caenorhabditis bovis TaxID=2654633 RepID=A0A8S1EG25_9PELO|nr:unnamed protein product [Caenorhabditis bovis]